MFPCASGFQTVHVREPAKAYLLCLPCVLPQRPEEAANGLDYKGNFTHHPMPGPRTACGALPGNREKWLNCAFSSQHEYQGPDTLGSNVSIIYMQIGLF